MPNDEFALALTDTKNDKRPIKDQIDDWNDVGIKSISEIIMATQVSLTEKSEANSSEGSSTPFSKRKEKDQVDQTSTSKKLCTKVVKMEKIKDDELNV
ncbi:hypothetical protein YC2023_054868 [Brassica napus]